MPAEPPPITVETNGIAYPAADGAIRLPASTGEIFVTIGDMLNGQRIRYQLDGIDRHWNERADNMRIAVIFYDHAGNHLDEQSFYSSGVSSGWRGTVDNSTFSHRSETLTVPAHTASLGLFMSSAGPPSAMGVFVVANLTISK
ncbi:MAG: hypothetical protein LBD30_07625, partial [Verrucomicrobiales bacterium]|nr:hypothetical protein [Verrucomicrobiales bacterium]